MHLQTQGVVGKNLIVMSAPSFKPQKGTRELQNYKENLPNAFRTSSPVRLTPPKTNMEPENEPLEEEIPIKNHHF